MSSRQEIEDELYRMYKQGYLKRKLYMDLSWRERIIELVLLWREHD